MAIDVKKELNLFQEMLKVEGDLSAVEYAIEKKDLRKLLDEYQKLFDEPNFLETLMRFGKLTEKMDDLKLRLNPKVYLAITEDPRNNSKMIIGRANWVGDDGKRTGIRVYVGKLDQYKTLENPLAIEEATRKVRKKIQELVSG